jgi:hypothetical protein
MQTLFVCDKEPTMIGKAVAYYHVTRDKQGENALGAQRKVVADYLNGGKWKLIAEFIEIDSGRNVGQPVLDQAIATAKRHKARLVIG